MINMINNVKRNNEKNAWLLVIALVVVALIVSFAAVISFSNNSFADNQEQIATTDASDVSDVEADVEAEADLPILDETTNVDEVIKAENVEGTYDKILGTDWYITETYVIPEGETATIDTNGYSIYGRIQAGLNNSMIEVCPGATLNIVNNGNKLSNISDGNSDYGSAISVYGGNLNLDGKKPGIKFTSNYGYNCFGTVFATGADCQEDFINGNSFSAGTANVQLAHCTFENNGVKSTSAPMTYGGALYNDTDSTVTLTNVNFINNSARFGGAIYNKGILQSKMSNKIQRNTGINGAGIYNFGGTVYCEGLEISGNSISSNSLDLGHGAGINSIGGQLFFTNFAVTGNYGEGIFCHGGTKVIFSEGSGTYDPALNISGNTYEVDPYIDCDNKANLILVRNEATLDFESGYEYSSQTKIPVNIIEVDGESWIQTEDDYKFTNNFVDSCGESAIDWFTYDGTVSFIKLGSEEQPLVTPYKEMWLVPHEHQWAIKTAGDPVSEVDLYCTYPGCKHGEDNPYVYMLNGQDTFYLGKPVEVQEIDQISPLEPGFVKEAVYYEGVNGTEYGPSTIAPTDSGIYRAYCTVKCESETTPLEQTTVYSNNYTIGASVTITGNIKDFKTGEGLPGVVVVYECTEHDNMTYTGITDEDGNYSIKVPVAEAGSTTGLMYISPLSGVMYDQWEVTVTDQDIEIPQKSTTTDAAKANITGDPEAHEALEMSFYKDGQQIGYTESFSEITNLLICDGAKIYTTDEEVLVYELTDAVTNSTTKVEVKAKHQPHFETYYWQFDETIVPKVDNPIIVNQEEQEEYNIVARYMPMALISFSSASPDHEKFHYMIEWNHEIWAEDDVVSSLNQDIYGTTKIHVDNQGNLITTYSSPDEFYLKPFSIDTMVSPKSSDPNLSVIEWMVNGRLMAGELEVQPGDQLTFEPIYKQVVGLDVSSDYENFDTFTCTYQMGVLNELGEWTWQDISNFDAPSYSDRVYVSSECTVKEDGTLEILYEQETSTTGVNKLRGIVTPIAKDDAEFNGWTFNGTPQFSGPYTVVPDVNLNFVANFVKQGGGGEDQPGINVNAQTGDVLATWMFVLLAFAALAAGLSVYRLRKNN